MPMYIYFISIFFIYCDFVDTCMPYVDFVKMANEVRKNKSGNSRSAIARVPSVGVIMI